MFRSHLKADVDPHRLSLLSRLALAAIGLLLFKVFLSILYEYRWYFPANFQAAFLIGRESVFLGAYRTAFYVHIVSSPLALTLATILILTGLSGRKRRWHREIGRMQILIVLVAVAPSGFVMALSAHTGAIAAVGFAMQAALTAIAAGATITQAIRRQFRSHEQWATRCTILLFSPLLLRLISGVAIASNYESEWSYQLTAWLSWAVPLAVYEAWRLQPNPEFPRPLSRQNHSTQGAMP